MRQFVYITFITNIHGSFHLQWKENLVKYLKVLKYYEHGCRSIAGPSIISLERRFNITSNFVFGYLKEVLGLHTAEIYWTRELFLQSSFLKFEKFMRNCRISQSLLKFADVLCGII